MDGSQILTSAISGGIVGGIITLTNSLLTRRTAKENVRVAAQNVDDDRYHKLVNDQGAELDRLKEEHRECKDALTEAGRDIRQLKNDVHVLQGVVVTQINHEGAKE